jgi:thioredoxin reductase (NADPH)
VPFDWYESHSQLGGTLRRVHNPLSNLPGSESTPGTVLAAQLDAAWGASRSLRTGQPVALSSTGDGNGGIVTLGDRQVAYQAVVLATGTRPRTWDVAVPERLVGAGVEYSAYGARGRYAGREVAVVGGGDAALEGALLLAEGCPRVTIVVRGSTLRASARFVDAVARNERIALRQGRRVTGLRVIDDRLEGVDLDDGSSLRIDGLFVRIGVEAVVPVAASGLTRTSSGRVSVDADQQTSLAWLTAAGDVAATTLESVAWAYGTGAAAATTAMLRVAGAGTADLHRRGARIEVP